MAQNTQLARALLALRLGVFVVMFMWALDKLVNPQHAAGVFEYFYGLHGFHGVSVRIVGVAELTVPRCVCRGALEALDLRRRSTL